MVRSSGVLAIFGVACLGACDARPLQYGVGQRPDGGAGDAADAGDATDGAVIVPARRLAVGDYFSCGLRDDRTAACWGFNGDGQATPASAKLISISAGARFACGLARDGTIVCWGANAQKQSTPPAEAGFTQISAGDTHACALASHGEVTCWGAPTVFTADLLNMLHGPYLQVASGTDVSCAIDVNHYIDCWGRYTPLPMLQIPSSRVESISGRRRMFCALDPAGHALCFDIDGSPTAAAPTDHFTQIGVGGDFACGLRDDGRIACWSTDQRGLQRRLRDRRGRDPLLRCAGAGHWPASLRHVSTGRRRFRTQLRDHQPGWLDCVLGRQHLGREQPTRGRRLPPGHRRRFRGRRRRAQLRDRVRRTGHLLGRPFVRQVRAARPGLHAHRRRGELHLRRVGER